MGIKSFIYNMFYNEANEDQIKEFYSKFSNIFELINYISREWSIIRDDLPTSIAWAILNKGANHETFEDVIEDFIKYSKCSDSIVHYELKNEHNESIVLRIISDRNKLYKLDGKMMIQFNSQEELIAYIVKEYQSVGKVHRIWSKCKCC